jgi:hypothetical protein
VETVSIYVVGVISASLIAVEKEMHLHVIGAVSTIIGSPYIIFLSDSKSIKRKQRHLHFII